MALDPSHRTGHLRSNFYAANDEWTVILLDIGLPKFNGYETCRRIREQPWSNGIFIVALTGWGQEEDRRRSQDAGFNHHLVKPVEVSTLEQLLRRDLRAE